MSQLDVIVFVELPPLGICQLVLVTVAAGEVLVIDRRRRQEDRLGLGLERAARIPLVAVGRAPPAVRTEQGNGEQGDHQKRPQGPPFARNCAFQLGSSGVHDRVTSPTVVA